jgi:phage shock protein E
LKKTDLRKFLFRYKLILAGVLVGGVFGLLYWNWVGCLNGTCLITGKPLNSTVYFASMGALLFSNFNTEKKPDGSEHDKPGE